MNIKKVLKQTEYELEEKLVHCTNEEAIDFNKESQEKIIEAVIVEIIKKTSKHPNVSEYYSGYNQALEDIKKLLQESIK